MTNRRRMLVTSALPYANGHLHLGHLVEHIQTDIWVRTHKMLGHTCISVCADDAHGTPIMLKAAELGLTPQALTETIRKSHEADFAAFRVDYDTYHTTHSPENEALATSIFEALNARGDILQKTIRQAFDPVENMFLPDRYVRGTCPRCKADDQYGDSCEVCGATYQPTELINPRSVLSGATPVEKESLHYFFDLPRHEELLQAWTRGGHLQEEVANKLDEWFSSGLKPWDISRDAPYFGFRIPGTDDKYFYVWLDAPIGYMASFKKYCETTGASFEEFWGADSTAELYHFIGKDIVYFHALFWPAMLAGSQHRLPTSVFAHGFLTVNGQKMSKSRGTFIEARAYLRHLNPEYLRYYFAAKLNGRVEDIDLNLEDFSNRVNADLVGKVVNIASRSAGFIHKYFEGELADTLADPALFAHLLEARAAIIEAYVARDSAKAVRLIMNEAERINQYIDTHKPWTLAKDPERLPEVQAVATMALNGFRFLMGCLKPVLPSMAEASEAFLQCAPLTFDNLESPLLKQRIAPFVPLMQRVEKDKTEALLNDCGADA